MNDKVKKALKEGRLIDYDKLFASYPKEYQDEIKKRARFIMARMEIRKLRKEKGFSQEQLAKKMNVKREFVSRIESGVQNITLETLFRIAQATGKEFKFSFK
jgi:DNA-binding XRE family transcriptional regulator